MRGVCEWHECGRVYLKIKHNQRYCSPECGTKAWNHRNSYQEQVRKREAKRATYANVCQYEDPDTGEACGIPTERHFLCDYHFFLGEQVEGVTISPRRFKHEPMD